MNPTVTPSAFRTALAEAMARKIAYLRQAGVVSMGFDCFKANVKPPSSGMAGAPLGTNARYYYTQMFRELVAELPPNLRTFIED